MKFAAAILLLVGSFEFSSPRDIQVKRFPSDISDEKLGVRKVKSNIIEQYYDKDHVLNEIPYVPDVEPSNRAISPRKAGCTVRIADLKIDPQPLFLKPGTSSQWPVSGSGDMVLATGDTLELFCPFTYVNPSGKSGSQTATCVSGTTFEIGKSSYDISDVTCSSWPEFTNRKTGEKCNGGEIIETGFPVGTRFVKQLEICFNEDEEVTRYVHHSLTPANIGFQSNVPRLVFGKGGLYGKKNVDKLYTQSSQVKVLRTTIGGNADKFIVPKENLYLARGHMAAKAEFVYATEQRGTFLFSNVAPQWQAFNAGNWLRVEDNTRNWVAKRNMNVELWTGVYGVTTLPNEEGIQIPIYLEYDKNNNGLNAVPMLFFKVIIEPSTKRGVVLIGVNNPYLTMEQIKKDYILCKDVSDKLDFLTWKKDDMKAGYSYACEVKDFAKKNPYLPKFDVKSLLY